MATRTRIFGVLIAAAVLGGGDQPAAAQGPVGPTTPPPFSPYLNLIQRRGNNSAAINYFGIVRPQIEFSRAIQNLEMQTARNRQTLQLQQEVDPVTGQPVELFVPTMSSRTIA